MKKASITRIMIVGVVVLSASSISVSLRGMEKTQTRTIAALTEYNLGNGNRVFLDDPDLDGVLERMAVGTTKGRYPINTMDVLLPSVSAIKKIFEGVFEALKPEEVKGLLISVAALLKENPDSSKKGNFKENEHVQWIHTTIVGFLPGKDAYQLFLTIQDVKRAYQLLKDHFNKGMAVASKTSVVLDKPEVTSISSPISWTAGAKTSSQTGFRMPKRPTILVVEKPHIATNYDLGNGKLVSLDYPY